MALAQQDYPGPIMYLNERIAKFYRSRLLSSILNDAPKLVIDFEFENLDLDPHSFKELFGQLATTIRVNRVKAEPFQLVFANYKRDGPFHGEFADRLNLDRNLVMDTPRSYLDLYPRQQLVYLSRDSRRQMREYDPSKIYIIGALLESTRCRFASYNKARRDQIVCESLPIDRHVDWRQGQQTLAIPVGVKMVAHLYHGMDWK